MSIMTTYRVNLQELTEAWLRELKEKHGESDVELRIVPSSSTTFNEMDFWKVINLLDWDHNEDDVEAIIEPAVQYLSEQDISAVYAFEDLLTEKLRSLDSHIYAQQLGEHAPSEEGDFSSDYFLYARACVVANGKDYYEAVLQDPSEMPEEYTFEALLSISDKAYERKTGKKFDYQPPQSYETYSNAEGWDRSLLDRLTE
jgi:hypothetical protein